MTQCQKVLLNFHKNWLHGWGKGAPVTFSNTVDNDLCFMVTGNHVKVSVVGPCSGKVNINVVVLQHILIKV